MLLHCFESRNLKTDLNNEIKKYLSTEDFFNELTIAGYDYIKKNNLIDVLFEKEMEIYKTIS